MCAAQVVLSYPYPLFIFLKVKSRIPLSPEKAMEAVTINIEGMSCGHCLNAVNRALGGLPGVTVDSVQMGRAELSYDAGQTDPLRILAAIEDAGYHAMVSE